MIRAFAIGLAVATMRPMVGAFFAFSGLPIREFFGTVFWAGFTTHAIGAEVLINCTRISTPTAPPPVAVSPEVETVNYSR
jgi:hypothetical protein